MQSSNYTKLANCLALVTMFIVAAAHSARADCFICDDLVVLDEVAAKCFLDNANTSISEAASNGYSEIDISDCTGRDAVESRGSLELDSGFDKIGGNESTLRVRTSFVLDVPSIECLKQLLTSVKRPITPAQRFDLVSECQAK